MTDAAAIHDHHLSIGGDVLIEELDGSAEIVADRTGCGVFLRLSGAKALHHHEFVLGRFRGLERYACTYRYEPYWMRPLAGSRLATVPDECQFLLVELAGGGCAVVVPLIDDPFHVSLRGEEQDRLIVVAESGDRTRVGNSMVALFIAVHSDPYRLMSLAAAAVAAHLGGVRLRRDKALPPFAGDFGWCTWDAFYQEVSQDKVRAGLESFAAGGVEPRVIILDDGWQSERTVPTGERRLTSFAANGKFPGDLAPTVAMAKTGFRITTFLVWHAFQGYWGGIDGQALPGYGVIESTRDFSPGIRRHIPKINEYFGSTHGLPAPGGIHRFYHDYHRHLRAQGVDGVKVDNQSSLEGHAHGLGGRIALMRTFREALEGSAHTHFQGNLINCMSCGTDVIYQTANSTITRSSTDFWPNDPASHGLHLATNALVSLWFGEFIHPDWDMFQSGHAMGAFHAAGRAVGGCPVYVSDKPGSQDFALLRKLVLSDGTTLRCPGPGRPTRDCLFRDTLTEAVLLKIFNTNPAARAGIVGVFNARHHPEAKDRSDISGDVGPTDVFGLEGRDFAVFAHNAAVLARLDRTGRLPISLAELSFELVTIVPIEEGFAAIGLADRFNSAGAISSLTRTARGCEIGLRDGGRFLAWSAQAPQACLVDGEARPSSYDAASHRLEITIPLGHSCTVGVRW